MNAKKILVRGLCCLPILSYGFLFKSPQKGYTELKTPIIDHKQTVILEVSKDRYISEVIAKSKYPYTLAAIAKVESNFKPRAVGDNGKSWGMYQIQQRIWKEFKDDTIESQTDKAEGILERLISEQGYYEAIKSYNGRGKQAERYRKKVLTLVKKMEYREKELNG